MGLQTPLLQEAFATLQTPEGHLAAVCVQMGLQASPRAAAPVTLRTLEGLLAAVDSNVFCELALLDETLAALGTAERPLPLVQAQVFLQVGFVPEGLATLRAREGPLPCVDNLVREETALQVVALLTLTALESLLPAQQHWAPTELTVPSGSVSVLWIFSGLPLEVAPLVLCQVALHHKDFPADTARITSRPRQNFQVTWSIWRLGPRNLLGLTGCWEAQLLI